VLITLLLIIMGCSHEIVPSKEVEILAYPITETSLPTINYLLPLKNSEERTTPITKVMIHFTSNAAENPVDPYNANDVREIFIDYGVSAHYIIGREGEIYLLVPENRIAYHAGKGNLKNFPHYEDQLNKYSIGIEMMAIGTKEEMSSILPTEDYELIPESHIGFTEAQYETLHNLITDIVKRYPAVKNDREHIIGHDEYAPDRKSDPGSLFEWAKIGF
ncbi:N-acetylmuramoyl-L-alanine amidase, partial [Microvirga sp. 3-52]|nr:N-acetylmuramoyl-L-alanine amidase [Microvirga sp. 3-52]